MSENLPENQLLPAIEVSPTTIAQFEYEHHTIGDLYNQLHSRAPNLAEYLRKRAAQLSPDLVDRERQARLALEIVSLINLQHTLSPQTIAEIDSLEKHFLIEPASDHAIPYQEIPPTA